MLIKCRNCGAEYSEYSALCPGCKLLNTDKCEFTEYSFEIANRDNYFSYLNKDPQKRKPIEKEPIQKMESSQNVTKQNQKYEIGSQTYFASDETDKQKDDTTISRYCQLILFGVAIFIALIKIL